MNYKCFILSAVFIVAVSSLSLVWHQQDSFDDWNQVAVRHITQEDIGSSEPVEAIEDNGYELIIPKEDNWFEVEISDLLLNVPFSPQAPFGEWDDPVYQDGCEEAAALMAVNWARGDGLTYTQAKKEILAMANYQINKYGEARDTSAQDTVERIFKDYFGYHQVEVKEDITLHDIIQELNKGNLVIVPANGQALGNPYYKPPGPERHNLVLRGYDADRQEFISNDSGTSRGEGYRYQEDVLFEAIRDYPSGYHVPIHKIDKVMIVVEK